MTGALEGSKAQRAVGLVLTALPVAFLVFDVVGKLLLVEPVVKGSAELGFSPETTRALGVVLLASTVLYVVPRTALVGVVLLTAYLGGAMAIHVQQGNPLATHVLFPLYVALFAWGGLFLREPRLRALLPLRTVNA